MMKDKKWLSVRLMDRLEIQYQGECIENALSKSKKARTLIELLILQRGEPVSVYKLYESLWGKMDIRNPESALKALVCRTRAMLGAVDPLLRDCIVAGTGIYRWNMEKTNDVDVFVIERLCEDLTRMTVLSDLNRRKLDRLLCMYTGNLLPEVSHEDWVRAYALRLEEQYKAALERAMEILRSEGDWETLVKVCRMGLSVLPFEVEWHEALMRGLIVVNRRNEALTQYQHVTDLHMQQLGVEPPGKIRDLYTDILRADSALDTDIDSIGRELGDDSSDGGAFVCEYAVFKSIYRLQSRSLERFKLPTFLAMVRVNSVLGESVQPIYMDEIMRKLLDVLRHCLRRGDTVTRYTASQYAILLQGASAEYVRDILDRIRMAFYEELGHSAMMMEYRYLPVTSKQGEDQREAL